uniref:Uncharacterized protein n=1 Tax=Entomoneis paludosa TaxID=265537 RepID=A0A7S3DWI3_9STRA
MTLLQKAAGANPDDDLFSTISFHPQTAVSRNFDVNPTKLYSLLNNKKWKAVLQRIKEAPEEASIWIYREHQETQKRNPTTTTEPHKDDNIRWRLLPLHAAIVLDAPYRVVEALVLAAPDNVRCRDDENALPIHVSCRMGAPVSVLRLLLKTYPRSVWKTDGVGQTPRQILHDSQHANQAALEHIVDKYLSAPDSVAGDSTVNTNDSSTDAGEEEEDDSLEGSSVTEQISIGELRKGGKPRPEGPDDAGAHKTPSDSTAAGPIKVAYLLDTQPGQCSADDSTFVTYDTRGGPKGTSVVQRRSSEEGNDPSPSLLQKMREKHYKELSAATAELSKAMDKTRKNSDKALQRQLQELDEKHQDELKQFNAFAPNPERTESIQELQAQHAKEMQAIRESAAKDQDQACQEVTNKFTRKLKEIEDRHVQLIDALQQVAPTPRSSANKKTARNVAKTFSNSFDLSSSSSGGASSSLFIVPAASQKVYDDKLEEMQRKYREEMEEFQAKTSLASEQAVEEARLALEQKHRVEMANLEKEFNQKIAEIRQVVNDLHAEMIDAHGNTTAQTTELGMIVHDLNDHMVASHQASRSKEYHLKKQVEDLKKKLLHNQDHSKSLAKQMHEIEYRLDEQFEREEIIEQRLKELQGSWLMSCFG